MKSSLALILLLPAAQVGHGPVRSLGRVVDARGQGVAGASVHLTSNRVPWLHESPRHEVTAKTDAKGRFVARLLPGRTYSVQGRYRREGRTFGTDRLPHVSPGHPIRLGEATELRPVRVRVVGTEGWPGGVDVFAVATGIHPSVQRLELDEEGAAQVLPFRGDYVRVWARSRSGLTLAWRKLAPSEPGMPAVELRLPEPVSFRLELRSRAKHGPIAGAWVRHAPMHAVGSWHPGLPPVDLGRTDEEGRLSFVVPAVSPLRGGRKKGAEQYLLAGGAGFAATYLPFGPGAKKVALSLEAGARLHGRLLLMDGAPARKKTLELRTRVRVHGQPGYRVGAFRLVVETDTEGRFHFDALSGRDPFLLVADRYELGLDPAEGWARFHVLARSHGKPKDRVDLGTIDLRALPEIDMKVLRADGMPAYDAFVRIDESLLSARPWRFFPDRHGRFRQLLPRGSWRYASWRQGGGIARRRLDVAAGLQSELRLTATTEIRGRVFGPDGQPVQGARARFWNRPEGVDHDLADLCYDQGDYEVRTDRQGRFVLHAALAAGRFRIRAWYRKGRDIYWTPPHLVDVGSRARLSVDLHAARFVPAGK